MRRLSAVAVLWVLASWGCSSKSKTGQVDGGTPITLPPPPPNPLVISAVAPPQGPSTGGTVLVIRGLNFSPHATVTFGGKAATDIAVDDPETLSLTTPPGTAGAVDVVVTNPDGAISTFKQAFTYYDLGSAAAPAPSVAAIAPNGGPASGGTVALLTGSNFQKGALVIIGGRPARGSTFVDATRLSVTTPQGDVGTAKVAVTNPDGRSGLLSSGFGYYDPAGHGTPAPQLTAIAPADGPVQGGQSAGAAGAHFDAQVMAFLGGVPVTLTSQSDSALGFSTPPNARGLADFAVTNADGQSAVLAQAYNYFLPPPQVLGLNPGYGPATGGTAVVIAGQGFAQGATATINGQPLGSLVVTSDETLTGTAPACDGGGPADVVVTNPDGLAGALAGGYFYTDATHPAPTNGTMALARVSPNTGPITGNIDVTAFGGGFQTGASVTVGSATASNVRVLGASSLTFNLPAGAVGPADISVTNPNGVKATLKVGFVYFDPSSTLPAPVIGSVSPETAPSGGGAVVAITGANFVTGARVFFGVNESTSVSVTSGTSITATVPPGTTGPVDLVVINPDGKSARLSSGFAYYDGSAGDGGLLPTPTVSAVSPASGPTDAPTTVTVTGTHFAQGAVVFAGNAAAVTRFGDAGVLSADLPPQPAGAVDIIVANPDGQLARLPAAFTYAPAASLPPQLTSISPALGAPAGNTAVLLSGANFAQGAQVFFGGLSAAATVLDSQSIRAIAPASSPGVVDVTVQNPNGQTATLPGAYEYRAGYVPGPAPTLAQLIPATGPATGGTRAVLMGTGFASGMMVQIGNHSALCAVLSDTQATLTVPPGEVGSVDVVAANPDGQYATLLRGFSYVDPATLGPAPTATGATPNHGPATGNTSLYVTGSNFKQGAIFFLGNTLATNILYVHAGLLRGSAPPASPGTVDLAVTNPDGQTAETPAAFTYEAAPTVTGVAPVDGPSAGGTTVLVSGSGYRTGATVYFGGNASPSVQVMSDSLLSAVTPPHAKGLVPVDVVDSDGQQAVLDGGFTFLAPPSVGSITPATGPNTGGSVIVISGSDFQPGVTVTIGGQPATVLGSSDGELVVQTPAGTNGGAQVVVTNPDGQTTTASGQFTYVDPSTLGTPPSLASVNPSQGPATGGTRAVFYGSNLDNGAVLVLGGQPLSSVMWASSTGISGLTPAGTAGSLVDAYLTNPDGQTAKLTSAFTYLDPNALPAAPQLFNVSPSSGSVFGGDAVMLSGQGFTAGSFALIDGQPEPTTGVTSTEVDFTTRAGPGVGSYDVSVTTGEGQTVTLPSAFTFNVPAPQPQTVSPSSGPAAGGTTVTLTGRNFDNGCSVKVGLNPATSVVVISPTTLTFTSPPGNDGPANLTVTNPDGQSGSLAGGPSGWTFVAAPSVSSISPTSGPVAGGTRVTLTGSYFRPGATVKIGLNAATSVTLVSGNVITATTPAGAAGPAGVTVTNADGQASTLAGGFTYLTPLPAPSVTGVSPNYGPTSGGTLVSVVGSGFQAGAAVLFGGSAATDVKVLSSTSLTCATPGGQAGAVSVTVMNPDSQAFTLTNGFTYLAASAQPPLQVLAVTPNTGSIAGGTTITISGRGIQNGAAVTVGGLAAAGVVWLGPTGIQASTPAHAAGLVDVTVTNPGPSGASATLANGFRYNAGGQYVAAKQVLPMESSGYKEAAVLFDFDNDGDSDLLILKMNAGCNNSNNLPQLYRNDNGTFTDVSSSAINPTNIPSCSGDTWYDAVVGDFNGDGWLDVFLIGNADRTLLLNNGGVFTWAANYNVTNSGRAVNVGCNARTGASGDVNSDGRLDMVVGCYGNDEQVFVNGLWPDGGQALYPDAGRAPNVFMVKNFDPLTQGNDNTTAIVLGDVDQDGDLDAFTVQDSNQAKQLYLNDGTGRFVPTAQGVNIPITSGNGTSAQMRDVNGDGCVDIVLGNYGQQDRLFLNDCTGHFSDFTASNMPAETDLTQQLMLMDVDHDGDYDLVALRNTGSGSRVRIYLNNGSGVFGDVTSANAPASLGEYTQALAKVVPARPNLSSAGDEATAYDLNSDGYPDLIELNQAAQNRFLENVGGGSAGVFQYSTGSALPEENDRSYTAVVGDINGDGAPDVIKAVLTNGNFSPCPPQYDGRLKVLINDGAGNLVDDTAGRMPSIDVAAGAMTLVDVDNDGCLDLFVTQAYAKSPGVNNAYLFHNTKLGGVCTGQFTDVSQSRLPSTNRRIDGAVAVAAIDYNKDGNTDLVIGNGSNLRLWENIGPGYFLDVTSGSSLDSLQGYNNSCNAYGGVQGISVGDLDGDGFPDLFLSRTSIGGGANNLVVFNQGGTGVFQDFTGSRMPSSSAGRQAVLFDADGDGDLDVYVANPGDDRLYFNQGGALSDVTLSKLPTRSGQSCSVGVVDVDRDGAGDVFLGKNAGWQADSFSIPSSGSGAQDSLLLNVGTGTYSDVTSSKVPSSDDNTSDVLIGDFNGDGKPDIYLNNEGQSRIYYWAP